SRLKTTSWTVTGLPSKNVAPERRCTTYVVGFGWSIEVANPGARPPCGVRVSNESQMLAVTSRSEPPYVLAGSRVAGSPPVRFQVIESTFFVAVGAAVIDCRGVGAPLSLCAFPQPAIASEATSRPAASANGLRVRSVFMTLLNGRARATTGL